MSGQDFWSSRTVKRLGIPAISLADGPSGVRRQGDNVDHLGLHAGLAATCFPSSSTICNSWNQALAEQVGACIGNEAVCHQVSVLLGPGLNIKRNPLCGRNFEYFSEDPYLSGKMAAAYIRGVQSNGIAACPKHFALNNQELLRMSSDSVADDRALHEIYLTAFEIAVKEGHPHSLMSSYNRIAGTYANEHAYLLRDILVDQWGFDGFVVSDWGGSFDHVEGVRAGSHLEMPSTKGNSVRELVEAVKSGRLPEAVLDQRVDEFLDVVFRIRNIDQLKAQTIEDQAHHAIALKAAEESIVLLKNDQSILPLQQGTRVAVIGDFAETPRYQGAGSSMVNPLHLDTIVTSMGAYPIEVVGYEKGFERHGGQQAALLESACKLAARAEVVLVFVGLGETSESEGLDRSTMRMSDNQIELLAALQKVNPNIVAAVSCGATIEMPWEQHCKGIIHAYLGGQAGATATLNVLTGKTCPSGKLGESYPFLYQDTGSATYYPGKEFTSEYRESIFVGYRYYDTAQIPVLYPFGYGLSYTSFAYSNLTVDSKSVSFDITNTGACAGAEIAQLYVGVDTSELFRAQKELKGFAKIELQPNETQRVTISFDDKTFRYYNVKNKCFEIEDNTYRLFIGASSRDIRLEGTCKVAGNSASGIYQPSNLPSYFTGRVKNVSDSEFEVLLGRKLPRATWDTNALLTRGDTFSQLVYAKSGLARTAFRVLQHIRRTSEKKGKIDLNVLYIYNITFNAIGKMANGMVDTHMVDALLDIVNGHFWGGLVRLLRAYGNMQKENKKLMVELGFERK